jgi:hypothetical protein
MPLRWPERSGLAAVAGPGIAAAPGTGGVAVALCERPDGSPRGLRCGDPWLPPSPAAGIVGVPGRGGWLLVAGERVRGLPLAVVRPVGSGPKLPLESLFAAGEALSRAEASGWEVVTAGSGAENVSARWLEELAPWNGATGDQKAWMRPAGLETVAEARRALGKLPLMAPADLERWALLEDFLRPFAEQRLVVGWVVDASHQPFSLVVLDDRPEHPEN